MTNKINLDLIDQQDTSANALTEVALGLSMAFFALLVIALISITMPRMASSKASSNIQLDTSDAIAEVSHESDKNSENNIDTVLFYYGGQLVNVELKPIYAKNIAADTSVVLAIDPLLTFTDIVRLQQEFSHVQLQLAKLTDEWKLAISNNQVEKL